MLAGRGVCPSCQAEGEVGTACAERACSLRDYRFIPREFHDRATAQRAASTDPRIGRAIADYLVVDKIGEGGFGKVYLALQMPIGMRAALKVMETGGADAVTAAARAKRFEGEAAALAALTHPNIVRLVKYGVYDEAPYLVMEYVENGRTLKAEIANRAAAGGSFDPRTVRDVIGQVLNALEAAHARDIVHRDIKPDNVMLQEVEGAPNFVKVLDFGLAKFVAERQETSLLVGTPIYMAPEQLERKNIGPWTDLYAVGAMTFEMLTGRRPFSGHTTQEILATKMNRDYDPCSRVEDLDVSPLVLAFLRRSLAVDTEARFRSVPDFRRALDTALRPATSEVVASAGDLADLLDPEEARRAAEERRRENAPGPARVVTPLAAAPRHDPGPILPDVTGRTARTATPADPAWQPPVVGEATRQAAVERQERPRRGVLGVVLPTLLILAAMYVALRMLLPAYDPWPVLRGMLAGPGTPMPAPVEATRPAPSAAVPATPARVPVEVIVTSVPTGAHVTGAKNADLGRTPVSLLVADGDPLEVRLSLAGFREETLRLSWEGAKVAPQQVVRMTRGGSPAQR